mmetsp:Transcript_4431/g.10720  ORF Transcript_4431/g.10720 Transcript_4431/m.10720 type:complete len:190 (+) Transcript_4431:201-770(+)
MSVLAAAPVHHGHAGFSMHDAASCRHAGDDCRLSPPPHHYIATKKRGWDTGREEDSYAAPETFGRVVRARLADIFERGDCDEEGTQTPEEEEETSNSHRKDDMETLADAFQVLMEADPVEVDGISCPFCRTTEARRTSPCSHCTKEVCTSCLRSCEICAQQFCSSCSTINYDLRYERELCFACNEESAH